MEEKENIIVELSFQFALNIVSFSENPEQSKKYIIANQILRNATSIGANIKEARIVKASKISFLN